MKFGSSILVAPALCLLVLGGIAVEKRAHTRPEDAEPFHARARTAIDAWPASIGSDWASREITIPAAAISILHPNTIFSRSYIDIRDSRRTADLLIVQCRDPTDMSGHYPPNCYRNIGERLVEQHSRVWQVAGQTINGVEYHFEVPGVNRPKRRYVYNFFILPGRGIKPDMADVRRATGDYQRRFFGAAQFQVIFPAEMSQETRDEIFVTIIGSGAGVLQVLNPPEIKVD